MANCRIKVAHNAFLNLLLHHSSYVFSGLSVVTSLHLQLYAVGGHLCNHIYVEAHVFQSTSMYAVWARNTAKYGMTAASRKTQILPPLLQLWYQCVHPSRPFSFWFLSRLLLFYQREDQLPYPQLCPTHLGYCSRQVRNPHTYCRSARFHQIRRCTCTHQHLSLKGCTAISNSPPAIERTILWQ